MTVTGCVAVHRRNEPLQRFARRHRTGYDIRAAALAVHIHDEIGVRLLLAVRVKFFLDDEIRARFHRCARFAHRAVHALDLRGFHRHFRALVKMHHRFGVHYVFSVAVARTVMLFHVFHLGVFADIKGVHAVVTGNDFRAAAIMNAAACDDNDVGVFTDIKIVIHHLLQTCLGDDDGNMHALVFRACFDMNINARFAVRFGDNLDIFRGFSAL